MSPRAASGATVDSAGDINDDVLRLVEVGGFAMVVVVVVMVVQMGETAVGVRDFFRVQQDAQYLESKILIHLFDVELVEYLFEDSTGLFTSQVVVVCGQFDAQLIRAIIGFVQRNCSGAQFSRSFG